MSAPLSLPLAMVSEERGPAVLGRYLDAYVQHLHPLHPSVHPPSCTRENVMTWLQLEEVH